MSDDNLNSSTEAALDAIETDGQTSNTNSANAEANTDANANSHSDTGDANQIASSSKNNAASDGGDNQNNAGGEKLYTEQQLQDIVNHRVAAERAKQQRATTEGAEVQKHSEPQSDAGKNDERITLSREELQNTVQGAVAQREAERQFVNQAQTLNNELAQARQEDADFNTLCEQVPNDVANKIFMVFAGVDNATAAIKTILQDKGLYEEFVQCNNPQQMSHILGRAYSAHQNSPTKNNGYQSGRALKNNGANESAGNMQSDASIDAIEREIFN